MKKIILLLLITFSVFSYSQITNKKSVPTDSTKKMNLNEINSNLNLTLQQVFNNNSGFKKEINYFSKLPFGENTIGNYDFKREKLNNTFVESLANILLNSKKQ